MGSPPRGTRDTIEEQAKGTAKRADGLEIAALAKCGLA